MGDEFMAPTSAKEVPFLQIASLLRERGVCEIESADASTACFRWPDKPRRDDWPEDAELSLVDDGLLLVVYAGTHYQRDSLVEAVSIAAGELLNENLRFEEL